MEGTSSLPSTAAPKTSLAQQIARAANRSHLRLVEPDDVDHQPLINEDDS